MPFLATICIPTFRRVDSLRRTLLSLRDQELPESFEVLVLDNDGDDELKNLCFEENQACSYPVRYTWVKEQGQHFGRHQAAHEAEGEILVYIDDDVLTPAGWLKGMLEPFKDDSIHAVGGKVLPQYEEAPPTFLSQLNPAYLSLLDLEGGSQRLATYDCLYGCNLAVRKTSLFEVGGFHPDVMGLDQLKFWMGDGEVGLCKKLFDAGYGLYYSAEAFLYHCIPSTRLVPEYFYIRGFNQGISGSYSAIRSMEKVSSVKLLKRVAQQFKKKKWIKRKALQEPAKGEFWRVEQEYCKGYIGHHLRALFNPKLMAYIRQKNYL